MAVEQLHAAIARKDKKNQQNLLNKVRNPPVLLTFPTPRLIVNKRLAWAEGKDCIVKSSGLWSIQVT